MENKSIILVLALLFTSATIPARSEYYRENSKGFHLKERVTHLRFYLFDILSGKKPTSVEVARPNITLGSKSATPFGHVYAIDDVIREGPHAHSKVIGNAQGLYVSTSLEGELTIVEMCDFEFTTGKFKGSSLSFFSRNPLTAKDREVAVVGGRGKFRMARGFAKLKAHYFNAKTGDVIVEYKVAVVHY